VFQIQRQQNQPEKHADDDAKEYIEESVRPCVGKEKKKNG
jgi:hypothetical protein